MPRYSKKITRLMDYKTFLVGLENEEDFLRRSLMDLLYLSGCRISEALNLEPQNLSAFKKTLYVQFYRLKGSRQTDPQEIPLTNRLKILYNRALELPEKIFPFCYKTAYRSVTKTFPELYPHYFRMNWITITSRDLGDAYVTSTLGLSSRALDHYRGKVSLKKVGEHWKTLIGI